MSDENLYAVRDEIVARLDQFMDEWGVKKIYTPKNLGMTTELSQTTPNIQVNFRRTKRPVLSVIVLYVKQDLTLLKT